MAHEEVEMDKIPDCDFCKMQEKQVPAKYDGATLHGSWAYMCEEHYQKRGVGLGLGKGQRLVLRQHA